MAETNADLVVIGAGAAGLWAAARAAERGLAVTVLEKTPRTGTKVLASGGTHCNLTTSLPAAEAARLFGPRGERFLRRAFRELGPTDVRERFAELGVPTVEAPLEKVFPASGRARDVRDALESWARGAGARIRTDFPVRSLEAVPSGWCAWGPDGERVTAAELFVCPGGRSVPRTGTTGDGYAWLEELGLELVTPVPALVPLTSPEPWVRELAGIDLQEVHVRLEDPAGKRLGGRQRPIVFTHKGVSGPGAMDLAEPVARAAARSNAPLTTGRARKPLRLVLDLVPFLERETLRAALVQECARKGSPGILRALGRALQPDEEAADAPRPVPKRLLRALLERLGLDPERPAHSVRKDERHGLVESLKGLRVPVDGTLGFDVAEVTAGGLALSAVDPGTMRVRERPGLFVFGELLDLTGPIGGLNFQAAFATAELAARALALPSIQGAGRDFRP